MTHALSCRSQFAARDFATTSRASPSLGGSSILRVSGALALLVGAGLSGCVGWEPARFKREVSLAVPALAASGLDVQTANGSIEARTAPRDDVLIEGTIKAVSQERADQAVVTAERDENGTLLVRVQWPENKRRGSEGCSFRIQTPDASFVMLDSSNGAVTCQGFTCAATLDSSNGSIVLVDHAGDAALSTSNGSITATVSRGGIHAESSNGRITIVGATGPVIADTSNGAINITMAAPAQVTADSSNGAIMLRVPADFGGTIEMDTSNGRITVPDAMRTAARLSKNRSNGSLTLGAGPKSLLDTTNGSITVELLSKAPASKPEPPVER